MTSEEVIKERVLQLLKERPQWLPKFCNQCGSYSSVKHQGVWCAHCSGKMESFPEMTYGDCIRKSGASTGWGNTLDRVYNERYGPLDWEIPEERKEMSMACRFHDLLAFKNEDL